MQFILPEEQTPASVQVFDMLGNEVVTFNVNGTGEQKVPLNTSDLTNGLYFIRLQYKNMNVSTRLLVIH